MSTPFIYTIGDQHYSITPANRPFDLLDAISVLSDDPADATGLHIWQGSLILSNFLFENHSTYLSQQYNVLELGCGLALPSFVVSHYVHNVVPTDGNPEVLDLISHNIKANANIQSNPIFPRFLCWNNESHINTLISEFGHFDCIIGADVAYDISTLQPLFETAYKLLTVNGIFILSFITKEGPNSLLIKKIIQVRDSVGFELVGDPIRHVTEPDVRGDCDCLIFVMKRKS
ncbi:hypothetical protein RCL1_006733 [Eukaryota sp. TZLM3-RCL]